MPLNFFETARYKFKALTGKNPVHEIGTGFRDLAENIDAVDQAHRDLLQAGVMASTDWAFTATINSGTGALGSTGNTGGTAWLPDPVVAGALMRTVTPAATLAGIAPSRLPASGKYLACIFELTPSTWNAPATVSALSGAEHNTQEEAEGSLPVTTAGKMQIHQVIIKNTGGVYSIVSQRDRRPWARGYHCKTAVVGHNKTTVITPTEIAGLAQRVECTGNPIQLVLTGEFSAVGEAGAEVYIYRDGVICQEIWFRQLHTTVYAPLSWSAEEDGVAAGSHLYTVKILSNTEGDEADFWSPQFIVREIVQQNANNGTS